MPGTSYGSSAYVGGYCWKIIIPQAATNRALNPEAGTTGNFAAIGGAAVARTNSVAKYGLYSFRCQTSADNDGISFTLSTLASGVTITMVARNAPSSWDWSVDGATFYEPQEIMDLDDDWTLFGYSFGTGQAVGSSTLYVQQKGAGSNLFEIDGVQVEYGANWTTFCSGERDGCQWNGTAHASTSTRSADSRAGGLVKDFKLDYGFGVAEEIGWGTTGQSVNVGTYATLPGGELDSIKLDPRRALLNGPLVCSASKDLNERRRDLLRVLSPSSYPRGKEGAQPVRLWYICADTVKEIAAHYEGGLDLDLKPDNIGQEKVSIRFVADDPNWYEIGDSAQALTTSSSGNTYGLMGRLRSLGQWSVVGSPVMAGSLSVAAILRASNNLVYIGGGFENFDGIANADGIVSYDPVSDTFSALGTGIGTGLAGQDAVYDIKEGPDGSIYVCGYFENCGGVAAADYIAKWNGTSWSGLGTPKTGGTINAIYQMAFDRNGNLYAVGNFTTIAGVANASYIAKWNGTAWTAVGIPLGGAGSPVISYAACVAVDSQNNVYVGGDFTNWASDALADYLTMWDGTSWDPVVSSTALDAEVRAIAIDRRDQVYVSGDFTGADGVSNTNCIFMYDGTAVRAMSTGLYGSGGSYAGAYSMVVAPDNMLYLAGFFTSAGGVDAEYAARWNGASFAHLDINPPGLAQVVAIGQTDQVVARKYDVWLGLSMAAMDISYYAGVATVSNSGTENVYPYLKVKRSGGNRATLKTLRNETSGYELYFDYDLRDGETLTVDLNPKAKNISSSFYGKRLDAVLANSDMGQWRLRPRSNTVSCFVDVAGAPTVTAWLQWRDAYNGLD